MCNPKSKIAIFKVCDAAIMLAALMVSIVVQTSAWQQISSVYDLLQVKLKVLNLLLLLLFVLLWYVLFHRAGLYQMRWLDDGQGEGKQIAKAVFVGSALLLIVAVSFQRNNLSWDVVLGFAGLAFMLTWVGRVSLRPVLRWLWQHNPQRLLLVGSNPRAHNFALHVMTQPQLGYHIVGYIDDPPNGQGYYPLSLTLKYLGSLQDFEAVIEREIIDEVVISLPMRSCYERIQYILEACEQQGIQAHLLSNFFPLRLAHARTTDFDGIPLLTLSTYRPSRWSCCVKRAFDLTLALCLVTVFSPLFVLIAVLIKLSSPRGPVFFVQIRVGYNRRHFKIIKFRSMVPEAERLQPELEAFNEANGPVFKIKRDPRITPLGRILRKLSLDELPQLFNVIKGDMSLVGPRPLPVRDVQRFGAAWLKRRFSVKPGITCLWQINSRSHTDFDTWIQQDLEYIDHWSLGLDLKILAKTIPVVWRGSGA
jgi:exopolysaccharide biosynthesis polyprenyl glycosylphosphotransferase